MMDPHRYDDMLLLEHPTSKRHPRMSGANRAAQFSPFAALTGYEDQIRDAWHERCDRILLSEEEQEKIGKVLQEIVKGDVVSLSCFVENPGTDGSGGFAEGEYKEVSGQVLRMEPESEKMRVGGADWWMDVCFGDVLWIRK